MKFLVSTRAFTAEIGFYSLNFSVVCVTMSLSSYACVLSSIQFYFAEAIGEHVDV